MTVSVKGAELFTSTCGQGPPCLVLCSLGTKAHERQTPAQLSDRLKLVYVDLRGSGRSTGDPADLTFDVLAEDLESVRRALGAPRIAVFGHSILGALAVEYGRRCPESVSHVITAGTPPSGDMARLSARSAAFFEQDASEERKRILRDNLAKLPPGAPPGQAMFAQTPMRFFDARFDAAPLFAEAELRPQFFAHLLGTLAPSYDITADPGSLRVPLFIALGRYDYTVPHVLWDGIAETLPDATLHLFEESGHQPFFEEPGRFAAAVAAWMDRKR
ncbi:alpha/beta fold hydrolase [Sorangium sp. So ce131]|uniref:alpha/beta fold hydrolase n=1 Tax=Sorangium sp. So ce131 TaxID=3133282 RepID=UPI003F626C06